MADRVEMTAPLGAGRARVAKARVEEFKANGWREVATPKPRPAPRRTRKATTGDDE